jgi:hypothetical protein
MCTQDSSESIDVVLDNFKDALQGIDHAVNAHDSKAFYIAGASTATVALVASSLNKFPFIISSAYLIVYALILIFSYLVYYPQEFQLPSADPVKAKQDFMNLPLLQSKSQIVEILTIVYERNDRIRKRKCIWLRRSLLSMNIFIVFTIILLVVPIFAKGYTNIDPAT